RDVHVVQPHLAIANNRIGVFELNAAAPQRLDLGSGQGDAGLPALEEVVAVARLLVPRDVGHAACYSCGTSAPTRSAHPLAPNSTKSSRARWSASPQPTPSPRAFAKSARAHSIHADASRVPVSPTSSSARSS